MAITRRRFRFTAPAVVRIKAAMEGGKRVRRFSVTAYNGGLIRPTLEPKLDLPVVADLAGMKGTDRARPVLLDHKSNQIVGHADGYNAKSGKLLATGLISNNTDHAAHVLATHDEGFPWQISMGADLKGIKLVKRGQTVAVNGRDLSGPFYLATQSTLRELSFVTLGADDGTSATIAARRNHAMKIKTKNRARRAAANLRAAANHAPLDGDELDLLLDDDDDQGDGTPAADVLRIKAIRELCAADPGGERPAEFVKIEAKAIKEGWDVRHTAAAIAAADLKARLPRTLMPSNSGRHNDAPSDAAVMEASICLSAGLSTEFVGEQYDERAVDAAMSKQWRGLGLHGVFFHVLQAAGRSPTQFRMTDSVIQETFEADRSMRAEGFSTVSLPGILGNIANKFLQASFEAVPTTWKMFCAVQNNKDFKPHKRFRLTGLGKFQEVGPAGEIKSITLGEEEFNSQVHTEGALITLTRQAIINDDISAFDSLPRKLGRMAAISIEREVFTLLASNPDNFFSNDHGNYFEGGGTVLGIASLTTAETMFLKQVDKNGDPTMVEPKVLLGPSELNVAASSVTRDTEIRDTNASKVYTTSNPHAGRFTPATSPWLSNANVPSYSYTSWYLFADPADVAAMGVSFLNGVQQPTVQSGETSFETLGIGWRAYLDFGAAMEDYRAAVKSKGSA